MNEKQIKQNVNKKKKEKKKKDAIIHGRAIYFVFGLIVYNRAKYTYTKISLRLLFMW